jgi:hypothetical protein
LVCAGALRDRARPGHASRMQLQLNSFVEKHPGEISRDCQSSFVCFFETLLRGYLATLDHGCITGGQNKSPVTKRTCPVLGV